MTVETPTGGPGRRSQAQYSDPYRGDGWIVFAAVMLMLAFIGIATYFIFV